jgi:hypothetical protein
MVAATLAIAFAASMPMGLTAAEPSPAPSGSPSESAAPALASVPPGEAMCESVADLRLIVEFVQGTDIEADGWLPVFVGVVAGLSEARALLALVDETYRPLVEDLVSALESLFAIVDQLQGIESIGSRVAAVGAAITAVGGAMDELSVALREPCPTSA